MAGEPLSYWDFVKAAALRPVKTRALGAMPLTQMLLASFGLAGLFNPGFWLLGVALFVSLVGGRSASARFQKLVEAERLASRREERVESAGEQMLRAYNRLEPMSQARYRALVAQCREILGIAGAGMDAGSLTDLRAGNLNQLLWLFLRLLSSRESISDTLTRVDRQELEADIASLRERIAAAPADGPLARSLQATLEIQEKRLANLETAKNSLALIDSELERIERQVRLVREESAVSGGPEVLSARLDAVSATLSETSRWMDQHAELFSSMAADDLDLGRMPSFPEVGETERPSPPPPPPRRRATRER